MSSAYYNRIPDEVKEKLHSLSNQNVNLQTIAFTPDEGWVFHYAHNCAFWNNIPQDAAEKIQTLNVESVENLRESVKNNERHQYLRGEVLKIAKISPVLYEVCYTKNPYCS